MAFWDSIINRLSARLAYDIIDRTTVQPIIEARAYRQGYYRPQLKVKAMQFDDNIGLNLTGLIESRIVSQMFGGGISYDFEGNTITPQEEYINRMMDANKQEVLFHRAAISAGEAGTGYLFIIPDGVIGEDGQAYPRLQLIDPAMVRMEALPEDYEVVIRYTIEYTFMDGDKERARRRVIEHQTEGMSADGTITDGDTWKITDFVSDHASGGRWVQVGVSAWPYDFPPIIHWQNLPSITDAYGEPDITDSLIQTQNRINFLTSNISKLIRYFAHPLRYGINIGEMKKVEMGPDEMVRIGGTDADIRQLEALGDLASSMEFLNTLIKTMYATARVVDLNSYEDKLGSLTNFGLKVLYQDNLNMIATKREIFGDMISELIRRVLILTGQQTIPVSVVWSSFLPTNEVEEIQALQTQLELGLISKETAAKSLGIDWDVERERIAEDKTGEDDLGARLLTAFTRGQTGQEELER